MSRDGYGRMAPGRRSSVAVRLAVVLSAQLLLVSACEQHVTSMDGTRPEVIRTVPATLGAWPQGTAPAWRAEAEEGDDGDVLFDPGVRSSVFTGWCWMNNHWQNFTDEFVLSEDAVVESIAIYTCIPPRDTQVRIKFGETARGPFFFEADAAIDSWTLFSDIRSTLSNYPVYEIRATLSQPVQVRANVTYWAGMHAVGDIDIAQISLRDPPLDDDGMIQRNGLYPGWAEWVPIGDQAFRLFGTLGRDSDGDGVPDHEDAFPDSDTSPMVLVGTCDSKVTNQVMVDGGTFNDLIQVAAAESKNHGQFMSAVQRLVRGWSKTALISERDAAAILRCAATEG